MATHKLKTQFLPLLSCIWISPNTLIAGGHGCTPMIFNVDNAGQIAFVNKLEEDKKAETSSKFSAKALFQTRDKMGVSDVADTVLNTTHQNQVRIILFFSVKLSGSDFQHDKQDQYKVNANLLYPHYDAMIGKKGLQWAK